MTADERPGLEEQLVHTLRRRADAVGDPVVRAGDLAASGRHETVRRRSLVAGVVAVAVVVAVGLGGQQLRPRAAPEPVGPDDPPIVGAVAATGPVPWIVEGPRRLRTSMLDARIGARAGVVYSGGVTLTGPYYTTRVPSGPWRVLGRTGLVELAPEATGPPLVSTDGSRAAWTTRQDDGTDTLVLHDLTTGRELDRLEVPTPEQGNYRVTGIDERDRVFLQETRFGQLLLWSPGSDLVEVEGVTGIPAPDPWPGGISTIPLAEDTGDPATLWEVAEDGTATAVGEVSRYGRWSPSGRRVAYAEWELGSELIPGFGPELLVEDGGRTVTLPPAADVPLRGLTPVGWESEDDVTVVVDYGSGAGPRQAFWRCDVTAVTCEVVADDLAPAPAVNAPRPPYE